MPPSQVCPMLDDEDKSATDTQTQELFLDEEPFEHEDLMDTEDTYQPIIMEDHLPSPTDELSHSEAVEISTQPSDKSTKARRSSRIPKYNARYNAFRQSLGRPLAKLGLIGTVIFLLFFYFVF